MIILIGGTKGGTGKTTLCTNLAAMRMLQGGDVKLLDTDKQGTASLWANERGKKKLPNSISTSQIFGDSVDQELERLSKKYQDIIVDVGGRDTEELRSSMIVADKLYIPIKPTQFDLWTAKEIDKLVLLSRAYNKKLKAYFIINSAETEKQITWARREIEGLNLSGIKLCRDVVIKQRVAFSNAGKEGRSVVELTKQDFKATKEITKLYNEVFSNE